METIQAVCKGLYLKGQQKEERPDSFSGIPVLAVTLPVSECIMGMDYIKSGSSNERTLPNLI